MAADGKQLQGQVTSEPESPSQPVVETLLLGLLRALVREHGSHAR